MTHKGGEVFCDLARSHELEETLNRYHRIVFDKVRELLRAEAAVIHEPRVGLELGEDLLLLSRHERPFERLWGARQARSASATKADKPWT